MTSNSKNAIQTQLEACMKKGNPFTLWLWGQCPHLAMELVRQPSERFFLCHLSAGLVLPLDVDLWGWVVHSEIDDPEGGGKQGSNLGRVGPNAKLTKLTFHRQTGSGEALTADSRCQQLSPLPPTVEAGPHLSFCRPEYSRVIQPFCWMSLRASARLPPAFGSWNACTSSRLRRCCSSGSTAAGAAASAARCPVGRRRPSGFAAAGAQPAESASCDRGGGDVEGRAVGNSVDGTGRGQRAGLRACGADRLLYETPGVPPTSLAQDQEGATRPPKNMQ